ncbi:BON1-associated protein 1 [Raphanus sativus]|nr:BON1-associated protein 1 [Raphanus sativus]
MTKTLEIDIRSAEGLKINRRLIKKKKTFAVARIGDKSRKTYLDDSGGSNPTWNFKSEMPMQGSVKFISIEVFYRTRCGRDKKIGEAPIPATDFMETTMFMAPSSSSSEPPSIDGYGGRIVTGVPVWRLTS